MDFSRLKAINEKKAQEAKERQQQTEAKLANLDMQEVVVKSFSTLIDYLDGKVTKSYVVNQLKEISTPDVEKVVKAVDSLHETLKTHENTDLSEVTKVLGSILDEAKKLPKSIELPEQKFVDYTDKFEDLADTIKSLEKVVEAKDLTVTVQPQENPAPVVNVEKPDLEPIRKEITNVVKSVKGLVFPEYKTDNKEVEKLLKKSNKLLEDLLDKPTGGGGGSSWMAVDANGIPVPIQLTVDGKIPVEAGATSTYESRNDTTTDANLVYLGKALPGSLESDAAWQIKRYNKSAGHMSFADDVTTFTKKWSERTLYGY